MCRLRILVVDDERTAQQIFAAILKEDEVVCVDSGEAAIEAAKLLQFDMVLMDLSMPGMGGIEATRRLMQDGLIQYPSRIWAISSHNEDEMVDGALNAGARDYFTKPIRPAFLINRLKTVRESIDLYYANQKALKRWQAIFDLLPDPVTITDLSGKYLDGNQAFFDEIKLPKPKVLGQTPVSLGIISAAERDRFVQALIKTGYVKNMEIVYRYPSGGLFFGSISARLVKNGTTYILAVTRNETEARVLREKTAELGSKVRSYEQITATLQEVASVTDDVIRLLQSVDGGDSGRGC